MYYDDGIMLTRIGLFGRRRHFELDPHAMAALQQVGRRGRHSLIFTCIRRRPFRVVESTHEINQLRRAWFKRLETNETISST